MEADERKKLLPSFLWPGLLGLLGFGATAEGDAGLAQIVRAHFHFNAIPYAETDKMFAHFS